MNVHYKIRKPKKLWKPEFSRFFRSIACMVVVVFIFQMIAPTYIYAQQLEKQGELQKSVRVKSPVKHSPSKTSPEQQMNKALLKIREMTGQKKTEIQAKLDDKGVLDKAFGVLGLDQTASEDIADLKTLRDTLKQLNTQTLSNFKKIEQNLVAKKLPPTILKRHQDAVDKYTASFTEMESKLQAVLDAGNAESQLEAVEALDAFMQKQKLEKSHQPLDPNNLPWGSPDAKKTRKPAKTKEELEKHTGLRGSYPQGNGEELIRLASTVLTPGMLGAVQDTVVSNAPTPEDLAETPDVKFTAAIVAKAAELNNDPVKIYNWVRNNIEFVPTYGSIQGADYTLQTMRGNAFDTSSLLIALLRAANIPARYGYGTVEVPIDKVMNWVGGVEVPEAALQLMGQGGIPSTGLTVGGKISDALFEHVWVEAWVDFHPSRGAKHQVGDSWIPLDGSFKQYEFKNGMDLDSALPFDATSFAQQLINSSMINDQEGSVQNMDQNLIQEAYDERNLQTNDFLNNLNNDETPSDVFGGKKIIINSQMQLGAGTPYRVVVQTTNYSVLPDELRHKFRYKLQKFNGSIKEDVLVHTISLPELSGRLVSLNFIPATEEDKQALLSFSPDFQDGQPIDIDNLPNSLPGYLINFTAEYSIDGEIVRVGGVFRLGEEISYNMALHNPTFGWQEDNSFGSAGEYFAIGVNPGNIDPGIFLKLNTQMGFIKEEFEKKEADPNYIINEAATGHLLIGAPLQTGIMSWFSNHQIQSDLLGRNMKVLNYGLPSYGTYSHAMKTSFFFGIPHTVELIGTKFDIDNVSYIDVSKNNNLEDKILFDRAIGMNGSANEHIIPERIFPSDTAQGISAVSALTTASLQGQRIYTLTNANASLLDQITIDEASRRDILAAISSGREVTMHESPISAFGWTGSGYIIFDPATGSGAYRISGGANGGFLKNYPAGLVTALFAMISALLGLFVLLGGTLVVGVGIGMLAFALLLHNIMIIIQADLILSETNCGVPVQVMLDLLLMLKVLVVLGVLLTGGFGGVLLGLFMGFYFTFVNFGVKKGVTTVCQNMG